MSKTMTPTRMLSLQSAVRASLVLLSLVLCGLVDYVTGYELSVILLYVVPVALCTRYFGLQPGLAIALLSTLVWMFVDRWSGHHYSQDWIWYVNAVNRMGYFSL